MAAIPSTYDYRLSTEVNWGCRASRFAWGLETSQPPASHREMVDYSYHKRYVPSRERFQDEVVNKVVGDGEVGNKVVVFTAGTMGVGKGYSMDKLAKGLLRLDGAVMADPDRIRGFLPEYKEYRMRGSGLAGELTQKESGLISELVQHEALRVGKPLVIDGSLKDPTSALRLIKKIRAKHPEYRIGIVQTEASLTTALHRAATRLYRPVPAQTVTDAHSRLESSLTQISPLVDFHIRIDNSATVPFLDPSTPLPEYILNNRAPLPKKKCHSRYQKGNATDVHRVLLTSILHLQPFPKRHTDDADDL